MEDNVRSVLTYCACVLAGLCLMVRRIKTLIDAQLDILSSDPPSTFNPPPQVPSISAGLRLLLLPRPGRIPDVINLSAFLLYLLAAPTRSLLPVSCLLFI